MASFVAVLLCKVDRDEHKAENDQNERETPEEPDGDLCALRQVNCGAEGERGEGVTESEKVSLLDRLWGGEERAY